MAAATIPPPTWAGNHAYTEISTNPQDYVFFLSKEEVPYGCFSNAYRETSGHVSDYSSEMQLKFWCVNQELHYQKAIIFQDHETAQQIINEGHDAGKIKQLGRMVKGYDDAKWCAVRYDVCRKALYSKFSQNQDLKRILLETGDKIIVEAAKDEVWGIGVVEFSSSDGIVGAKNKETGGWDKEPNEWTGENLLGRCLMDVRKMLLAAEETSG